MKMNSIFRLQFLALFMAMLIFSTPFTTLARQKSVEVQAKMAAEQDAKADVNGLLWTGTGCLSACLGIGVGTAVGVSIIESGTWLENVERGILGGVCTGGLVCGLFSLVAISYRSDPSPQRLLGKSPEYVDFYAAAYKTKIQQRRAKFAAVGALTSCGLILLPSVIGPVVR